jgi:hypothetical protein
MSTASPSAQRHQNPMADRWRVARAATVTKKRLAPLPQKCILINVHAVPNGTNGRYTPPGGHPPSSADNCFTNDSRTGDNCGTDFGEDEEV